MGQGLPRSTQILLDSSDFVQEWGVALVIGTLVLISFCRWLLSKEAIRLSWDQKVLAMPIIGKITKGLNTARFARTLSICTSSAIPILEGMKVAVDVMTNQYAKKQVLLAVDGVREGASLRKALEQTRLFPQ